MPDQLEETLIKIQDALENLAEQLGLAWKDYIRKTYPERACPNCDFVAAEEGEEFLPCPGTGSVLHGVYETRSRTGAE